jgi:DNA-binding response OmpR family regulator
VLLADDDALMRELLRSTLSDLPFRLLEASTLARARELLQRERPSLLVLDVLMSDGSGVDFLREVRGNPEQNGLPVILLTVEAHPTSIETGLAAGANAYLTKPFSPSDLIQRIERLLSQGARR